MNNKFSPKIALPLFAIALIAGVIIFSNSSNKKDETKNNSSQMPDDEIHKSMKDQMSGHGSDDVMENVKHMMMQMQKKIEANPEDTLSMREYADMLAMGHKPDEALKYYQMILKKDSRRVDILFGVTNAYYLQQDYVNAELTTKQILKIEPKNLQAMYNLGAIAAQKGDKERAKQIFKEIVDKFPGTEAAQLAKDGITRLN